MEHTQTAFYLLQGSKGIAGSFISVIALGAGNVGSNPTGAITAPSSSGLGRLKYRDSFYLGIPFVPPGFGELRVEYLGYHNQSAAGSIPVI